MNTNRDVEGLAFAHWQLAANERAFTNRLITRAMFEFAKEELNKTIDRLSKICYTVGEGR